MKVSDNAVVAMLVGAVASYMAVEYVGAKRREFLEWRVKWIASILKTPGKREYLRDQMMREEFTNAG